MEIFISSAWGTVFDDWATSTDAAVVCRQLGYNTYGIIHIESDCFACYI